MRTGKMMLLLAASVGGVLTPIGFSGAAGSTAECTTCCPDPGAKCVVCAESCTATEDAYDRGVGKCKVLDT